jgi:AhpD family alkylhydroperoxidase
MKNPALAVPGAIQALMALNSAIKSPTLPETTLYLVHLRASQINGCSLCVDMHSKELRKAGTSDERLFAVAAWREAPYFTDAERAALALAEAGTLIAHQPEAVSDAIWEEAGRHFSENDLAVLVMHVAQINLWNRINAMTRQVAGSMGH